MSWKSNYAVKVARDPFMTSISGVPSEGRDYLGHFFIILIIALFAILPLMLFFAGKGEEEHCAKWEYKMVHQNAWTQFIWSGKTMIPIYHAARDVDRKVCVQPK